VSVPAAAAVSVLQSHHDHCDCDYLCWLCHLLLLLLLVVVVVAGSAAVPRPAVLLAALLTATWAGWLVLLGLTAVPELMLLLVVWCSNSKQQAVK
jgi:hypothetical protein